MRLSVLMSSQRRMLIALLCVGLAACGGGTQQVEVDFLWTSGKGRSARQGTSGARVQLTPNDQRRVRIGVVEDRAMQTGNMMRASVWIAATQAAMALGQDLAKWRVLVDLQTHGMRVDGPSAGGLLTVAMMAAMRGESVDSSFTMTGTINPDGTIGPVGGIPNKLAAAARKGKQTIGYPTGQRFSRDKRTGRLVDLRTVAQRRGVTSVEVDDIYAAYKLATGVAIERPSPVQPSDMELPPAVYKMVQARTLTWLKAAVRNHDQYKKMGLKAPLLDLRWNLMRNEVNRATGFIREGSATAAYRIAEKAFTTADSLLVAVKFVRAVGDGHFEREAGLFNRWKPNVTKKLGKLYGRLQRVSLRGEHDLMTLVDAFEAGNESIRALREAKQRQNLALKVMRGLKGKQLTPKQQKQMRSLLHQPLHLLVKANIKATQGLHHLQFRDRREIGKRFDHTPVLRLVDGLKGAADANLSYFEATVIANAAATLNMSEAKARSRWKDPLYRSARMAPVVRSMNNKLLGRRPTANAIAKLANSLHVYHNGAALVAKHYSLGIRTKKGKMISVRRTKAFSRMLELAERSARENAASARKVTGRIPVAAKLAYQTGRNLRDQTKLDEKFEALRQFWRSSLHSRLVVTLHRIRTGT